MCVKKTNVAIVGALVSMGFTCNNCPVVEPIHNELRHYVTQVIEPITDTFMFFINLSLLGDILVIRFFNITSACERMLSVNIPETFETTFIDKFCQLRRLDDFIQFIHDPLNNTRQV
jgi:hypothetical protein